MKQTLPVAVAFISGLIMVVAFFMRSDVPVIGGLSQEVLIWGSIVGGFTLLLGAASITRVNFNAVRLRRSGWGFNLITLVSVFVMALPAILGTFFPGVRWFGTGTGSLYDWMFTYISIPMQGTMFAMLAFYIASAAYRAFRARTAEATLLLLTASLVMLWRVPLGEWLLTAIHSDLPSLVNTYVMSGVNLSVQRGIIIGAALGAATMSLRILLGIERTYMGRG